MNEGAPVYDQDRRRIGTVSGIRQTFAGTEVEVDIELTVEIDRGDLWGPEERTVPMSLGFALPKEDR